MDSHSVSNSVAIKNEINFISKFAYSWSESSDYNNFFLKKIWIT